MEERQRGHCLGVFVSLPLATWRPIQFHEGNIVFEILNSAGDKSKRLSDKTFGRHKIQAALCAGQARDPVRIRQLDRAVRGQLRATPNYDFPLEGFQEVKSLIPSSLGWESVG